MPNVRDHDLSVYLRLQGNGLSIGGYEPHPDMIADVSNEVLPHPLLLELF